MELIEKKRGESLLIEYFRAFYNQILDSERFARYFVVASFRAHNQKLLCRVEHAGGDARDQTARSQALTFDAQLVF